MRVRATWLEQLRVVRNDGGDIGGLRDFRVRANAGPIAQADALEVDALLVGARQWLARLGFTVAGGEEIRPNTVSAIESDRIVVRAGATLRRTAAARTRQNNGRRKKRS